jgi:maleylpyruvate isomerase
MRLYAYYRSSASYRVRLALEHKGLSYEVVSLAIAEGEQRDAAHRARNPIGQVPVLELDVDGETIYLAQSLAIIEYLDEIHPASPLLPSTPLMRQRARELAEIVNSGTQPLQNISTLEHVRSLGADAEAFARRYIENGLRALAARSRSTRGAFLIGDAPSIADVCLVPQMFNARAFGIDLVGLEALVEIDARAQALPRWSRAHPLAQPDAPKP